MAEADASETTTTTRTVITEDLRNFYARHGVDVDRLQTKADDDVEDNNICFASRFIRLNPRIDTVETLSKLKTELEYIGSKSGSETVSSTTKTEPIPVPWLDEKLGFYALPGNFKLSQSNCYQEGRIYGMDVSSGAAVVALLSNQYDKRTEEKQQPVTTTTPTSEVLSTIHPGRRVLDLCCAPGLKLCALADYLASLGEEGEGIANNTATNNANSSDVVVGVDISEHRIATAKRILHKYRMQEQEQDDDDDDSVRIRLYCGDGTKFDQPCNELPTLVFDSKAAKQESVVTGKRKRMNKSAKARERQRLKSLARIDFYQQSNDSVKREQGGEQSTSTSTSQQQVEIESGIGQAKGTAHSEKPPSEEQLPQQSTSNMASSSSSSPWIAQAFDFVLVDAECSTDGSLKHIQKQINAASTTTAAAAAAAAAAAGGGGGGGPNGDTAGHDAAVGAGGAASSSGPASVIAPLLMDSDKLAELVELQKELAASGYRLLKPGGSMVYSTCSLSWDQNENVVQWLLKEFEDSAYLVPLDFTSTLKKKNVGDGDDNVDALGVAVIPKIKEGQWGVRFEPSLAAADLSSTGTEGANSQNMFFGGGFFLAKIGKKKQAR